MNSENKHQLNMHLIKWGFIAVVVVAVLIVFKPALMRFIDRTGEVQIKKGDIEVVIKAGIELAKAEARRSGGPLTDEEISEIAEEANKTNISKIHEKTILWVDDTPSNNRYEIKAFQQIGINVVTVANGEEALNYITKNKVDVIISDFKRANDPRFAGYGLFDELKQQDKNIPYVIYSASSNPQYRADSKSRGLIDQTNRAVELFSAVMSSIVNG
jgi:CheY-like chemotaxis protein